MGKPLVECRCGFARGQLVCLPTLDYGFTCPFCKILDVGEQTFISFVKRNDTGSESQVNAVGRKCAKCGFVIICCRQLKNHDSSASIY